MNHECELCNINFNEENGDNWFFLLIIDRALFIFPIIVAYYFGYGIKIIITIYPNSIGYIFSICLLFNDKN